MDSFPPTPLPPFTVWSCRNSRDVRPYQTNAVGFTTQCKFLPLELSLPHAFKRQCCLKTRWLQLSSGDRSQTLLKGAGVIILWRGTRWGRGGDDWERIRGTERMQVFIAVSIRIQKVTSDVVDRVKSQDSLLLAEMWPQDLPSMNRKPIPLDREQF